MFFTLCSAKIINKELTKIITLFMDKKDGILHVNLNVRGKKAIKMHHGFIN